ncbi:hypothetical protein ACFX2C_028575 [Malus domestica]
MDQEPRIPVSLHEYFPNDFFQQCTTVACHMVEVEMEEPLKGKAIATEGEKTLTLKEEDDHEVQESKNEGLKLRLHECAICCVTEDAIHFTDEDLLLGSKPHNRHLFVSGYVREHKVNRMLVDGG